MYRVLLLIIFSLIISGFIMAPIAGICYWLTALKKRTQLVWIIGTIIIAVILCIAVIAKDSRYFR